MRNPEQVVDQEYLQIRSKILEIAAFLDRLAPPGELSAPAEVRLELLRRGCELLLDTEADKAARVQLLFSRQYDAQWRQTMGV
jgi:hypothetical protein